MRASQKLLWFTAACFVLSPLFFGAAMFVRKYHPPTTQESSR